MDQHKKAIKIQKVMPGIINTGKFFLQHQLKKYFSVDAVMYSSPELKYDIMIYKPVSGSRHFKTRHKVILAFHGMTMLGSKDPKFISVCRSLSGCGYTVIAPQMDSMQNLQIVPSDIEGIAGLIDAVTNNSVLCPEGRLSIFAASFAGGVSLIASSDSRIAQKINTICLIGSFSSIEKSTEYLLSNQDCDSYGRIVILKNFLKYSTDLPDNVYKAFDIALSDNFFKKKFPELPAFMEGLSLKEYDTTYRLLYDTYFRLFHWSRIKKNEQFEKMSRHLSMNNYLEKISASILVIHGIHDDVIPPIESVNLFRELTKVKAKTKLILTPLMGHSEIKMNIGVLLSLIELLTGMSFFFGSL